MRRHAPSLDAFLANTRAVLREGPIAMIFAEDEVEIASTLHHHARLGFKTILAFVPAPIELPDDLPEVVWRIDTTLKQDTDLPALVNRVIAAAPGQWIYYCYNAEYLFFPFCETRSIGEMLAFHSEERRGAMLTYAIDLYAKTLDRADRGVNLKDAHLDAIGYYAEERHGADGPLERQKDFYGGLRLRFDTHIPQDKRRIDRIGLFRAKRGLTLQPDHTLNDAEYNTYACPWHNNLTAAICSFRTAKALCTNPGSRRQIETFDWPHAVGFEWTSQQLLELGLIEPGQWF